MGYWNFWQVLNAKDYGVPQNRERVFVVSILGGGQYLFPNKIKLEKRLKDILEPQVDEKYYLNEKIIESFLHKINPSEDICIGGMQANQSVKTDGVCTCLTSSMGTGGGYVPMVTEPRVVQVGNIVETDSFGGNPQRGRIYSADGCSPALNTMQGGGLEPKILESYVEKQYKKFIGKNGYVPEFFNPYNCNEIEDVAPTLTAQGDSVTKSSTVLKNENYRIRKLTPRECWRLMGVKDEQYDKLHDISNTQLYKMAGNSIVVDVLMGIFKNLFLSDDGTNGQLQLF